MGFSCFFVEERAFNGTVNRKADTHPGGVCTFNPSNGFALRSCEAGGLYNDVLCHVCQDKSVVHLRHSPCVLPAPCSEITYIFSCAASSPYIDIITGIVNDAIWDRWRYNVKWDDPWLSWRGVCVPPICETLNGITL